MLTPLIDVAASLLLVSINPKRRVVFSNSEGGKLSSMASNVLYAMMDMTVPSQAHTALYCKYQMFKIREHDLKNSQL